MDKRTPYKDLYKDRIKRGSGSSTLATTVYDRLRSDIMTGALRPGEKLRAEFLRSRYEVGNSPVREALNRLSSERLVCREDQKGFHVAAVGENDLLEVIKTRCWLEEKALRESIANGGDDWEEALVLANHRLSKAPHSSSETGYAINREWEELHHAYHRALISACGSVWLQSFCDQLMIHSDRYRLLATVVSYPERDEMAEHRAITEASINRDPDKAVGLLHDHFNWTAKTIGTSTLLEDIDPSAPA